MNINENEKIKEQKHDLYDEFELQQIILNLEAGERVVVQGFDKDNNKVFKKEFKPKFINTHLNILFQDKGAKKSFGIQQRSIT